MATKTKNYNLIKPALEDDADIRVINGNMDVLDNQLKSISDKADNASDNAYSDVTVLNDYTWKFTKESGTNVSYDTIKTATAVKNTTGIARITANNGAVSNVFEVTTSAGGSQYNFNGLTTYMNSNNDYFRLGGNDAYLRLSKNKELISNASNARFNNVDLYCNTNTDYFYLGVPNHYIAFNKDNELYVNKGTGNHRIASYKNNLTFIGNQNLTATHSGYVKFDDNLLIQWGYVNSEGTSVWNQTVNLPLPYANRGYVSMITLTFKDTNHTINYDNRDIVYNQSESAIGVWSDTNNVVHWMTIGQGA